MSSSLIITILLFLLGLVLIVKGGDWFVDAATWMAAASGLPQFLIGATVVSMATTLPEIIVSTMAAAEGSTDLAIGNAIGSVTANTGLIMAISLIFMPVAIRMSQFSVKGVLMVLSTLVLWLLCRDGLLSLPESLIVLVLFIAFLIENIRSAKKLSTEEPESQTVTVDKSRQALLKNIALFVIGAACLVVGSNLLVNNGTVLAQLLGVSERIIAVTMVAIGTSLPELVTAGRIFRHLPENGQAKCCRHFFGMCFCTRKTTTARRCCVWRKKSFGNSDSDGDKHVGDVERRHDDALQLGKALAEHRRNDGNCRLQHAHRHVQIDRLPHRLRRNLQPVAGNERAQRQNDCDVNDVCAQNVAD